MIQAEDIVIEKIKNRRALGLAKYGISVSDRTDLTTQQWLQHAQDEAMDFAIYLQRLMQQRDQPVGFDIQELHSVIRALEATLNEHVPAFRLHHRAYAVIKALIAELGRHDPMIWGNPDAPKPQGVIYARGSHDV